MSASSATDPHNLQRFLDAQAHVIDQVLAELRDGRKRSHWMWFIFPQIAGLGSSPTAQHFAISGRAEALAYLDHPTLGRIRTVGFPLHFSNAVVEPRRAAPDIGEGGDDVLAEWLGYSPDDILGLKVDGSLL